MKRRHLLSLASAPLLAACATPPVPTVQPGEAALAAAPPAPATAEAGPLPPPPPREWRAAWIATVANIDWPSKPGLSAEAQQAEIRALCDTAVGVGLNALILQVRTSNDALYESKLEPWSEYLTGTQGQHPGYDPLAVWLKECRARGLELHAWFNPYRSRHSSAKSAVADSHVSRTHPDWVKRYGDQLWMDPGEPQAAEHTLAVVRDLLSRYAVDGVHIDDYFYPYPIQDPATKQEIDFPDEPSWQKYLAKGGSLSRHDWRRYNVNTLVQRLYALAHEVRPGTRVGVSPFGMPKPAARPPGISGFSQYDKLYADVELWLREGWMDYLAPQLYWPRAQTAQAFEPLLQAWRAQNPLGRPIHPGLFTSRINDTDKSWQPDEVLAQIDIIRSVSPGSGHVHFSMAALAQNRKGIADALRSGPYAKP
ncbi:family 10 glycosylhydrolase [Roseateles sp.]|uniref:glycoside hydrolase family 10 protein n=1 Tax=Roseateles sp. TaxID=1971397 RepID=UPI0025F5DA53|nr:family 10 glycosylhydrolase [Roseateles sp.]MBV8037482.1 family 10 glycosylhydrolase [Roseateles sp.]